MKISYNHINKMADSLFVSVEEMKNAFNQMGLEVEGMKKSKDGDTVFDLEITPNRPDLLWYVGVLREIAATKQHSLNFRDIIDVEKYDLSSVDLKNELKDPSDCEFFLVRKILDVKMVESPDWLKVFLEKHEIRPRNILVDIGNFVMLETGQPGHIYDADKVKGEIKVADSIAKEKVVLLDKSEIELTGEEVVIRDTENNFLCLGWVMGGFDSAISEETTNIYIENAYFKPSNIRYTSRRLKISTDASFRFERGTDCEMMRLATDKITKLILEYCGGKIEEDYLYNHIDYHPKEIKVDYDYFSKLLGVKVELDFIVNSLEKLGFETEVKKVFGHDLIVKVPSWRSHDVKFDICLVEEVGKVYGFDNIPEKMPVGELNMHKKDGAQFLLNEIEEDLIKKEFNQVINFSFVSPNIYKDFDLKAGSYLLDFVVLNEPLGVEYSVMRTSLIPGLIKNYYYNLNRGETNFKLFEIGRTFHGGNNSQEIKEINRIAGLYAGKTSMDNWKYKYKNIDFFDLKSIIFDWLRNMGFDTENLILKNSNSKLVSSAENINIFVGEQLIGFMGKIKPGVLEDNNVFIFEFNYDEIINLLKDNEEISFINFSKFPSAFRDFSFIANKEFPSANIIKEIRKIGKGLVKGVRLFDVYEGKNIDKSKVSLAYRIEFNSKKRSLTGEEVNANFNKMIKSLTTKYDLKLREE